DRLRKKLKLEAKENNSRFHRSLTNLESYGLIVGVEDPHPEKHLHANIWQTWDTRTHESRGRASLSYSEALAKLLVKTIDASILSDRLAPTDLQPLLLEVSARRAKRRDPKALLDDHVSNRFTQPSVSNPRCLLEWDRVAFSKLPKDFRLVELSPVCPLGAASVLSPISQDWIVSTIRNTEVVADSTNVLALECAV